jgi:hypothetical protein
MFKKHNVMGFCLTLAVFFAGTAEAQEPSLSPAMVDCNGQGFAYCIATNGLSDPQVFPREMCSDDFDCGPFVSCIDGRCNTGLFVIVSAEDKPDPLYVITTSEGDTAIDLVMDESVLGADLNGGFSLVGLFTSPPGSFIAPIEAGDIEFLGDWTSLPSSIPSVSGPPPGQRLEWSSLQGADPRAEAIIRINLPFGGELPSDPVDLTGTVQNEGGTPLCALVLASGQFMFSCNPNGPFSLTDLPRAADGSVKRQVYVDGFFPNVETLTDSTDDTVVMTPANNCPDYNAFPEPGVVPDSDGKRIDVSGTVLLQNSDIPVCAMVLGNGQFGFTCDGTGTYSANIPLDANGQYKLQVYADGFAPMVQAFDEFTPNVTVRMAQAAECQ